MWARFISTVLITTALVSFFLFFLLYLYEYFSKFKPFPYEVFGMIINGIVGIGGIVVYASNLRISGKMFEEHAICDSTHNCQDAADVLLSYSIVSTFRFVAWYSEFVTSFLFIALFLEYKRTMTFFRYLTHTINLGFSIAALILVTSPLFPAQQMIGYRVVSPCIIQSILLGFVIMSYWLIAQSKLYRVPCLTQMVTFQPSSFIPRFI